MTSGRTLRSGWIVVGLLVASCFSVQAGSHTWVVNEIFSNTAGTVQFVELFTGDPNEVGVGGKSINSNASVSPPFTGNVPGPTTNKHLLIATAGFQAAFSGAPTPDLIMQNNFLNINGDTIKWHIYGASVLTFGAGALPTDGTNSLDRTGATGPASPTNYNGDSFPPPGANNLLVEKHPSFPNGSRLFLTWNDQTCLGDGGNHLVIGSALPANPGDTYTGLTGKCNVTASTYLWSGTPNPASGEFAWFLIMSNNGTATEGSWGKDSSGTERDGPMAGGASGVCSMFTKDLANTCN